MQTWKLTFATMLRSLPQSIVSLKDRAKVDDRASRLATSISICWLIIQPFSAHWQGPEAF